MVNDVNIISVDVGQCGKRGLLFRFSSKCSKGFSYDVVGVGRRPYEHFTWVW